MQRRYNQKIKQIYLRSYEPKSTDLEYGMGFSRLADLKECSLIGIIIEYKCHIYIKDLYIYAHSNDNNYYMRYKFRY